MKKVNNILVAICLSAIVMQAHADGRFVSLKKDEVNLRTGPGERYPILWVYQERGYPVKVLDEFDIWRQVQEADGSIGWVHKNMLSDRRTALVQEEGPLTNKPDINARTVAVVQTGTIGKILQCPAETPYCLLSFHYQQRDIKGWFPRDSFWGVDSGEEIN